MIYIDSSTFKAILMSRKRKISWGSHEKKIICIETQEVFNSIKEAQKKLGYGIMVALRKINKTAQGYHWAYLDDKQTQEELKEFVGQQKHSRGFSHSAGQIRCVETNQILEGKSALAAMLGTSITRISNYIKKNKPINGRHWVMTNQNK